MATESDNLSPQVTEGLTARRAEIVRMRASGMSVREIGDQLGIDHAAVVRHLQHPAAKVAIQRIGAGILDELREDMRAKAPEMADRLATIALGLAPADAHMVTAARAYLAFAGLAERQEIEMSGGVTVAPPDKMSDDELEAEYAALQARRTTPT